MMEEKDAFRVEENTHKNISLFIKPLHTTLIMQIVICRNMFSKSEKFCRIELANHFSCYFIRLCFCFCNEK